MLESLLALFSGSGLLGGALIRGIPMLVEIWKHKKDSDHEYRMTRLQLEVDQARAKLELDAANVRNSAELQMLQTKNAGDLQLEQERNQAVIAKAELEALAATVTQSMKPTGYRWVDIANAMMRPIAFYWHCVVMYSLYKALLLYIAVKVNTPLLDLVPIMYNTQDAALFSSIMGFLFVDRALRTKPSHG